MAVIHVEHLRKEYETVVAVEDISFEVEEGEIFGMVGPNGAGKTTTIEILEGLRFADRGTVSVLGLDPRRQSYQLCERIGTQLQESELPDRIRVREVMELYSSFYQHSVPWEPLIDRLGLHDKTESYFSKLSGGQKQRLYIALALVNEPNLIFLDELTTGLDPQARRVMWELIEEIRGQGKTVFLTTHLMEEAEYLCDRVAIIDRGKVIALDTPENLVNNFAIDHRVSFTTMSEFSPDSLKAIQIEGVNRIDREEDRVIIYGKNEHLVQEVVNSLAENNIAFRNLRSEHPTLDDVFLSLTGRELRD